MNAVTQMQTVIGDALARAQSPIHRHPLSRCIADVKRERLSWLWPARIPLGKVSMLAGDPGLGKSLITVSMAAVVSDGSTWPIHGDGCAPQGDVVMVSGEDDAGDTIRPRLEAARADLAHVHILDGVQDFDDAGTPFRRPWTLADLPELEELLDHLPTCKLITIDPVSAYLAGTDSHKNSDVRALMMPLAELAARRKLAVVTVSHLNKSQGPAAYRVTGSLAFTAAARAAYCVTKDKADPGRRILVPLKTNLAPDSTERAGCAYRVVADDDDAPRLEWEPEPFAVDANEVLAVQTGDPEERSELSEAAEWLRTRLEDGRPVPARELRKQADESGFAWRTLQRSMHAAGVRSTRDGFGGPVNWILDNGAIRATPPSSQNLGAYGAFGANGQPRGFQGIPEDHPRHTRQAGETGAVGANGPEAVPSMEVFHP